LQAHSNIYNYTDSTGKKDEFIFIPSFMNHEFNKLMNDIFIRASIRNPKIKTIKATPLATQILKYQNECSCAPKIEQPPTVRELTPIN
jgi:hypothetical protein